MKWYQRAWAYVSRKRVRVGLLFLILSLITTAVLAVFAIQISTQQVQDKLLSLSNAGFQLQGQGLQAGMKESDIRSSGSSRRGSRRSVSIRRAGQV